MPDPAVAVNVSHSAVIRVPGEDIWYMIYARSQTIYGDGNTMLGLAYDRMYLEKNGFIKPVKMLVKNYFNNQLGNGLWIMHNGEITDYVAEVTDLVTTYTLVCLDFKASESGMLITPTSHAGMQYGIDLAVLNSTLGEDGSAGVVFHGRQTKLNHGGSDDYEGYYVGITVDKHLILGVANGSFTMLESVSLGDKFDVSDFHHLRILAEDGAIFVYLDHGAVALIHKFDGTYSSGWSGMRVHRAEGLFDNLEISKFGSEDLAI